MGEHSYLPPVLIHTLQTYAPVLIQASRRAKLAAELAAKKQLEEVKVREMITKRCLNTISVESITCTSLKWEGRIHRRKF